MYWWPDTVVRSCELTPARRPHRPSVLPEIWTLHGLWPQPPRRRFSESWYRFRNRYGSLDSELKDFVDNYWTALCTAGVDLRAQQKSFLKHEWEGHGNYQRIRDLEDFVQTAKDYFELYDIYYLLKKHGIVPRTRPYKTTDIISALNAELGRDTFVLNCGGRYLNLMEVRVCLGKLQSGIPTAAYPCGRFLPSDAPMGNCPTSDVYYQD